MLNFCLIWWLLKKVYLGLACKTLLYALHALFDTLLLTKDKCFNKGDEATQTLMTNTFQYLVTIKVFILPKLMLVIRTVFILLNLLSIWTLESLWTRNSWLAVCTARYPTRSLRKHPFLLTSPVAKSGEKRMFSQAIPHEYTSKVDSSKGGHFHCLLY